MYSHFYCVKEIFKYYTGDFDQSPLKKIPIRTLISENNVKVTRRRE